MNIAELFRSVQGEGILTGQESVFVRTSGCNLRCWFCDTPYTSWRPEGKPYSIADVLAEMERLWDDKPGSRTLDRRYAVLTGGEPLLDSDLPELCQRLHQNGWHITIETAGTVDAEVICDLMSISPKLSNSTPSLAEHPNWHQRHNERRYVPAVLNRLVTDYPYQLKFVVTEPEDWAEIQEFLEAFPSVDCEQVWLMPEGTTAQELQQRAAWLEPLCAKHRLRFCPRKQIEWFGHRKGT